VSGKNKGASAMFTFQVKFKTEDNRKLTAIVCHEPHEKETGFIGGISIEGIEDVSQLEEIELMEKYEDLIIEKAMEIIEDMKREIGYERNRAL